MVARGHQNAHAPPCSAAVSDIVEVLQKGPGGRLEMPYVFFARGGRRHAILMESTNLVKVLRFQWTQRAH